MSRKNPMMIDDDVPVVLGNCIMVRNVDDAKNEDDKFVCIQVESENGKDEYPILMTEEDFHNIEIVELDGSDKMVAGRLYRKRIGRSMRYCVKLNSKELGSFVAAFEMWKWKEFFELAVTHPKSCTRKNLITDIMD